MIIAYVVVIYRVWTYYQRSQRSQRSVSHLICEPEVWPTVVIGMLTMIFFTCLYEAQRQCALSWLIMMTVCGCLLGVIAVPTTTQHLTHITLAFILFLSIIAWMWVATTFHGCGQRFRYIQLMCLALLIGAYVADTKKVFLVAECLYLLNFAACFLFLHTCIRV